MAPLFRSEVAFGIRRVFVDHFFFYIVLAADAWKEFGPQRFGRVVAQHRMPMVGRTMHQRRIRLGILGPIFKIKPISNLSALSAAKLLFN